MDVGPKRERKGGRKERKRKKKKEKERKRKKKKEKERKRKKKGRNSKSFFASVAGSSQPLSCHRVYCSIAAEAFAHSSHSGSAPPPAV
jgi:hypothetical protein